MILEIIVPYFTSWHLKNNVFFLSGIGLPGSLQRFGAELQAGVPKKEHTVQIQGEWWFFQDIKLETYFMISSVHIHNHMHIKQTILQVLTRVLENFPKHFCFLISFFANQAISNNLMNFSFSANLELFLRSSCCYWGKVNWFPVVVRVKGFYSNLWESREHCVIIRGERHFRQDFKCDAPCDAVGDWDAKIVLSKIVCHHETPPGLSAFQGCHLRSLRPLRDVWNELLETWIQ